MHSLWAGLRLQGAPQAQGAPGLTRRLHCTVSGCREPEPANSCLTGSPASPAINAPSVSQRRPTQTSRGTRQDPVQRPPPGLRSRHSIFKRGLSVPIWNSCLRASRPSPAIKALPGVSHSREPQHLPVWPHPARTVQISPPRPKHLS